MELFLSDSIDSYFLELLVSYIDRGRVKPIKLSPQAIQLIKQGTIKLQVPSLITEEGNILTNTFPIAQYICELSYAENVLIGKNNRELAELLQVFEAKGDLVEIYTKILEPRVFVAGNHVTVADLFLYTRTYDQVALFTDQEKKTKYVHFFRWFKHIQSLPRIKEFNESHGRVLITLSPFVVAEPVKKQKK